MSKKVRDWLNYVAFDRNFCGKTALKMQEIAFKCSWKSKISLGSTPPDPLRGFSRLQRSDSAPYFWHLPTAVDNSRQEVTVENCNVIVVRPSQRRGEQLEQFAPGPNLKRGPRPQAKEGPRHKLKRGSLSIPINLFPLRLEWRSNSWIRSATSV